MRKNQDSVQNCARDGLRDDAGFDEPALIFITDKDGLLSRVNQAFATACGHDAGTLPGRAYTSLWHPAMPAQVGEELQHTLAAGRTWMGILRLRGARDEDVWLDCYIAPIREQGQITGYQAVCAGVPAARQPQIQRFYASLGSGRARLLSGYTRSRSRQFVAMLTLAMVMVGSNAWFGQLSAGALLGEAVLGGVLALGLGWWLSRRLCGAVGATLEECNSPIARRIYGGADDEVGQLRLSAAWQAARLRALVGRVTDYSERLNEAARAVRNESELAGRNADDQQTDIEQVAAAVNEMSATVQQVAHHAAEAARAAEVADEESDSGKVVIVETMGVIDQLADGVSGAAAVIARLEQDSEAIGKVVEVINSIAEQTNLLALNAAIEAARAGEQGRGFAVVADEVRTLATRTQASTEEIGAMIQRLQDGTREAVKAMADGGGQAMLGVEQAEKAVETLAAIAGAVDTINRMNAQIAQAAEQQSAVANDINESVSHISERAQMTAAGAEQASRSSESLCQLAGRLSGIIRTF